jgi:hypothetical protein
MKTAKPAPSVTPGAVREIGAEEIFSGLQRTDRACRLLVKYLRESHPDILESAEFEHVYKLARRQIPVRERADLFHETLR